MPRVTETDGSAYLADLTAETTAVYKYFDFFQATDIAVRARGHGTLELHGEQLEISSEDFQDYSCPLHRDGIGELVFRIFVGKVDILSFTFGGDRYE